jgi:hypothetical protein
VTGWNFACADWEQRLREGRSLVLQCPRCSGVIEEKHKFELSARGAYEAPFWAPASGDAPEWADVARLKLPYRSRDAAR